MSHYLLLFFLLVGPGLDPDITSQSARAQIKRVAAARQLDE